MSFSGKDTYLQAVEPLVSHATFTDDSVDPQIFDVRSID